MGGNSDELIGAHPNKIASQAVLDPPDDGTTKSLGVLWSPSKDAFRFKRFLQ